MGVVVLHADELDALALERVLASRGSRGAGRGRRPRGVDREQALEVLDALAEGAQRLVVLEVADVVADPGALALGEAEGALQLGAAGQQRPRRRRPAARASRARSRASGAAAAAPAARRRRARPSRRCACGSAGRGRGSGRRSPPSRSQRVVVAVGDRLVGDVAAGHHQRLAGVGEQQVVQRRVGQHHAELARARARPRRATARARAPAARARSAARGRASSASSAGVSVDQLARGLEVGAISANGLSSRCLRARSRATASLVVGAAGEVEAAEALDRDDRARRSSAPRPRAIGSRASPAVPPPRQPRARPAVRAGVRLGVEAAVAPGPRTRPGSAAHIAKPAIVVSGRS